MKLEEKLDILVQLILRARTFFDFWWISEGVPTRSKYLNAMDCYSEFFRFDSHAHQIAYTIYFCQIFQDKKKTLNIKNVLNEAKTKGLSAIHIEVAEKAFKEGLPIWKKLQIIRNNLFAHRNSLLSYSEAFKKASLTPNEIRRLSELCLEAINSLRKALSQKEYEFSSLPRKDFEKLLNKIDPKCL
jgi:hypothetical protein